MTPTGRTSYSRPPYQWLNELPQHHSLETTMYNYTEIRPQLFTEEGQRVFLKIRDNAHRLCTEAGCVRAQEAWARCAGDDWLRLACIDRLVELGEIRELTGKDVPGQHQVFVRARG